MTRDEVDSYAVNGNGVALLAFFIQLIVFAFNPQLFGLTKLDSFWRILGAFGIGVLIIFATSALIGYTIAKIPFIFSGGLGRQYRELWRIEDGIRMLLEQVKALKDDESDASQQLRSELQLAVQRTREDAAHLAAAIANRRIDQLMMRNDRLRIKYQEVRDTVNAKTLRQVEHLSYELGWLKRSYADIDWMLHTYNTHPAAALPVAMLAEELSFLERAEQDLRQIKARLLLDATRDANRTSNRPLR
ncbi:MAG: hypothetical protein BWY68_00025 [bacterium ADurb.Bin400]|nr:MAG: hypothetical protein BWY68_00025 [bacterium ADurb.Bin400]